MIEGSIPLYEAGLRAMAEKHHGVAEAIFHACLDLVNKGAVNQITPVLETANSMYPGEMYVEGLREKSGEETALLETTKETIRLLTQGYSEEHIGRTKRAFTWLTGKTLP